MEPPIDPTGKTQLKEARHPDSHVTYGKHGPDGTLRNPVRGPWDADADHTLRTAPVAPNSQRVLAPGAGADQPRDRPNKATARRLKLTQVALAMRAAGEAVPDIAARLAVSPATVIGWFTTHRRAVAVDDLDAQLDAIAMPLATENLIHGLIAGDKDYTLETLKGRGAFKRHAAGDAAPPGELPVLTIRFETPGAAPAPGTGGTLDALQAASPGVVGRVHGTPSVPKQIAGPVIGTAPLAPDPLALPATLEAPADADS